MISSCVFYTVEVKHEWRLLADPGRSADDISCQQVKSRMASTGSFRPVAVTPELFIIYPETLSRFDPDGFKGATGTPLDDSLSGNPKGCAFPHMSDPRPQSQQSIGWPFRWPSQNGYISNAENGTQTNTTATSVGSAVHSHKDIKI
jgi:hypothetical protein